MEPTHHIENLVAFSLKIWTPLTLTPEKEFFDPPIFEDQNFFYLKLTLRIALPPPLVVLRVP